MSDFSKERAQRGKNVALDVEAMFALLSGDYDAARDKYQAVLKRHEGKKLWIDKQRQLKAHHSLACIAMLDQADFNLAAKELREAKGIADKLAAAFPSAAFTKWMKNRYATANEMQANLQLHIDAQLDLTQAEQQQWLSRFNCDDLQLIQLPAPPPEGWQSIREQLTFSFSDVVSPVNLQ